MLISFGHNRKQYPTYCQSGDGHRQINLIPGLDFFNMSSEKLRWPHWVLEYAWVSIKNHFKIQNIHLNKKSYYAHLSKKSHETYDNCIMQVILNSEFIHISDSQ